MNSGSLGSPNLTDADLRGAKLGVCGNDINLTRTKIDKKTQTDDRFMALWNRMNSN
ncbi:hypothetical protein PN466_06625 [Roseofilum reptotaenium CS-1145]|uniref:hypothetical protein n=1 Tax=Roseofilum reptotaenium TaxID=1233427 RepID=UPI000AE07598|nr:hypothetical protein [Roseofilum reptotaenium]MDB9516623.1 hypothetical protein [Roseofilum reptotaenium CS-1145]